MKSRTNVSHFIALVPILVACGGRVDVAELRASVLVGQDSQSPDSNQGPAATNTAPDPQTTADPAGAMSCYDNRLEAGNPAANGLWRLPSSGCVYNFVAAADSCTGTWDCCGEVFTVTSHSLEFVDPETQEVTQMNATDWTQSSVEGNMGLIAPEPWSCALEGGAAATVAAYGFGYSPAWGLAVSEFLGEPAPELDAIPRDCVYTADNAACGGTLACAEHSYRAAVDASGAIVCQRDAVDVAPAGSSDGYYAPGCDAADSGTLPIDVCFGPGWMKYFLVASPADAPTAVPVNPEAASD